MTKPAEVLIVDDESSVRQTLKFALQSGGIGAESCDSAESALSMLREGGYRLLVVDKNLPEMGGLELLREVRGENIAIRAMMITGYASVDAAMETLQLGVDGFLEKPFDDIFDVVDRVRASLGRPDRPLTQGKHFSAAVEMLRRASSLAQESTSVRVGVWHPERATGRSLVEEGLRMAAPSEDYHVFSDLTEFMGAIERESFGLAFAHLDRAKDGFSVVDSIRAKYPELPLLVTCDRADLGAVVRLIDSGVRTVLELPFTQSSVEAKAGPWLRRARQKARADSGPLL